MNWHVTGKVDLLDAAMICRMVCSGLLLLCGFIVVCSGLVSSALCCFLQLSPASTVCLIALAVGSRVLLGFNTLSSP